MEMAEEDLYTVLQVEVEKSCQPALSAAVIRKAYRKRALELHPDKRGDDPVAAAEFQKLQRAYEILSDEKARAAYDELQRVRKERFQKASKQSEKRQKMMQDLVARELAAEREQKARAEQDDVQRRFKAEVARIRKSRAMQQGTEPTVFDVEKPAKVEVTPQDSVLEASDTDRTIKASWSFTEGGGGDYSATRLKKIFEEFGEVEDVVVRQGKARKKSSALIVMGSKEAAVAATQSFCGDLSNPLLVLPVLPNAGAPPLSATPTPTPTPHVTVASALVGESYRMREESILRRMRQASERARLEKEIRENDGKEE